MSYQVHLLSEINPNFEELYIRVRSQENRIYSDEEVKLFPKTTPTHPQKKEWLHRENSAKRFLTYLNQGKFLRVLEIGCGNGWFTNYIASNSLCFVDGIDINMQELNQGNKLFSSERVQFYYGDIFNIDIDKKYDMIVFNASFHYFENSTSVITRISEWLNPDGEIHILDSMLYNSKYEAEQAKKRTIEYYESVSTPELASFYFHLNINDFQQFNIHYSPSRFKKLFSKSYTPLYWISYSK